MRVIPESRLDKIQFYETRLGPWETSAAAIGLTAESVLHLATLTTEAREAYLEHLEAQNAARAATQKFYDKVRAMHDSPGAGSDMIAAIRNFAQATNNREVYIAAILPAPEPRGTVPPPGKPSRFTIELLQTGELTLGWKCSNPRKAGVGTMYHVERCIIHAGSPSERFEFLGVTGTKSFTDRTLPRGVGGSGSLIYQVTAIRSTARGESARHLVNIGTLTPAPMASSSRLPAPARAA